VNSGANRVRIVGGIGALLALLLAALGSGLGWWSSLSSRGPHDTVRVASTAAPDAAATARDAMSAVSAARQLLLAHEATQAAHYLDRADHLLALLDSDTASTTTTPDYVTLYSVFTLPDGHAGRGTALWQLRPLGSAVGRSAHDQVLNALRQTGRPFVYRYLDLSLAATSRGVRQARAALDRRDERHAASILDDLEQRMRETVVAENGGAAPALLNHSTPGRLPAPPRGATPDQPSDKGAHS
jgi:hypothetical protein